MKGVQYGSFYKQQLLSSDIAAGLDWVLDVIENRATRISDKGASVTEWTLKHNWEAWQSELTIQNQGPNLKECTAYKLRSSPHLSTRYRSSIPKFLRISIALAQLLFSITPII